MSYDDENKYQDLVLLTDEARQYLNPREEIAYQEFRLELAECRTGTVFPNWKRS